MGCTGSRFDEMPITGHPHGLKVLPGSERFNNQHFSPKWNNSQVHDEGPDGAEVEGEVLQLQWRRLHHQGYGRERLVQVIGSQLGF